MTHLIIRPSPTLHGNPALPGDKSISHRALILGALADGETEIANLSPCGDVGRTINGLQALGVEITRRSATEATVSGRGIDGLAGPPVSLDCGDSGTTMRLLAGVLTGQDRAFVLDGSEGLRRRPMHRIVEPLRAMGAEIEPADGGTPPLAGRGGPLRAADVTLAQASAQAGSAVLLAALGADGVTRVRYPSQVRDHTERMLSDMGGGIDWDAETTSLAGPVGKLAPPGSGRLTVLHDLSAAAFPLAAAALVAGSSVRATDVTTNPGRTGLLEILSAMGAHVAIEDGPAVAKEPSATVAVRSGSLSGVDVGGALIPRTIDELPLVAVLGTQARGRTVVRDARELRTKASDRIAAMVDGLALMGAAIEERDDGFVVEGPTPLRGAEVDGRGDHRVVMSLAVAGLIAEGTTVVSDAECVADSYPGFVEAMRSIGAEIRVESAEA